MDRGYTYSNPTGSLKVTVYAADGIELPDEFPIKTANGGGNLMRLSDRSLRCGAVDGVKGSCESYDCHRLVLGECRCGRHKAPVRFQRVETR